MSSSWDALASLLSASMRLYLYTKIVEFTSGFTKDSDKRASGVELRFQWNNEMDKKATERKRPFRSSREVQRSPSLFCGV